MNHTVCLPAHRIGKQLSIPANTVPNFIDRVSRSVAKKIMRDPRNYAYLPWGDHLPRARTFLWWMDTLHTGPAL